MRAERLAEQRKLEEERRRWMPESVKAFLPYYSSLMRLLKETNISVEVSATKLVTARQDVKYQRTLQNT